MTTEEDRDDLNLLRSSIQSRWSPEEKELRRRAAGNKQLQLKQLLFLKALASQKIRQPAQVATLMA
ncbi:MAG TPA: hypothetical protein DEF45_19840 [Rhodopirellula sp.]|nr:MAG: hypothetical protein CBD74_01810 [Saprospirales bacterium TMED214]HBV65267.1 hypothetical protein [Rhodopirellula sp.]